jgi:protein-S-isoprenylcysteine O-methyltransferase Ste14
MIETFGEEYRRYMAQSWRHLPGTYQRGPRSALAPG